MQDFGAMKMETQLTNAETFNKEVQDLFGSFNDKGSFNNFNGSIETLKENLEALAKKEYDDIIRLFVDKDGRVENKYSNEEKIQDALWGFWSKDKRKQFREQTNSRIVNTGIDAKLNYVKEKCRDTNTKLKYAESSYENYLNQMTQMRVDCVEYSDYAEKTHQKLQQGSKFLEETKRQLEEALQKRDLVQAKSLQKQLIEFDRSIRLLEKKKTDYASKTIATSNRLLYIKACYAKARAYKDVLSENVTVLEQMREHITSRIDQYKKSGNLFDIVEYVKLGEELKETKETFDKNFEQSYPLLQEVEKAYRDLAKQNTYTDSVNSERNSRDEDLFRKALQARDEVMKMDV